jgi:hypothetical protein
MKRKCEPENRPQTQEELFEYCSVKFKELEGFSFQFNLDGTYRSQTAEGVKTQQETQDYLEKKAGQDYSNSHNRLQHDKKFEAEK